LESLHPYIAALDRTSFKAWFWTVLFVSIVQRVGLLLLYQPVHYGDTPSYRRLADALLRGLEFYDGTRTPGYPLFLALLGPDERVWLVQMLMGVGVTLLFFYLGWQITRRSWLGGIAALSHTLNIGQLFFEPNILSETLTTFLISLTLAGITFWLYHPQRRSLFLASGLGLAASLALLVRPLFIYFPFWILLFLVIDRQEKEGSWFPVQLNLPAAVAFLLPVTFITGGWVNHIHNQFGDWSLTTMTGYHLIQHTGIYFEKAPDEYASLRDTYLKYRDQQIAARGNQANAIWDAIPEMQQVSGYNFYDLSRVLAKISVGLIKDHPELYLRSVVKGWYYFWRVPVYWSSQALRLESLATPIKFLVLGSRLALIAANLLFLISTLVLLLARSLRKAYKVPAALWCIAGSVWFASVLQTVVDHGDNPRFLVPMQSMVVLWVLWLGFRIIRKPNLDEMVV
jgi:4-amino-4-deoxy-L-arabinose transferase-like glycosyltransferase